MFWVCEYLGNLRYLVENEFKRFEREATIQFLKRNYMYIMEFQEENSWYP